MGIILIIAGLFCLKHSHDIGKIARDDKDIIEAAISFLVGMAASITGIYLLTT